jgi:hypothetical protein
MADEGFLQRWSRRKAEARTAPEAPEAEQDTAPGRPEGPQAAEPRDPLASTGPRAPDDAEAAVDLEALPDIDTLTYESDFTGFMRKGVPPELRKRALQRLWRSNPTLANLDGLVEYGEDYTKIGTAKQVVRTAYQVGRGMLERIEPEAPGEPPAPDGVLTTADRGQTPETTDPAAAAGAAAPGLDRVAAPGADENAPTLAARPEKAAPRPEPGAERHAERSPPPPKPRPLPRRS